MGRELVVSCLAGTVDVAYRRDGRRWLCTALPFDIVGTGDDRESAFGEMQELFAEFLEEVIASKEPVRFFNFADETEWESPDRETYLVAVVLTKPGRKAALPKRLSVEELRGLRRRIVSTDLVPLSSFGAPVAA